jgi:serine/threonine-protein kinase
MRDDTARLRSLDDADANFPRSARWPRRHRLVAELARGGMGTIFVGVRARHADEPLVAVKTLRDDLVDDPAAVDAFFHEAAIGARLRHPNVVRILEAGTDGGVPWISMELLDGQPLERFHLACGRARHPVGGLDPRAIPLRALSDALLGLHAAHALSDDRGRPLGLVHRDATPDNVFVTYDGIAKIIDFGIAKTVDRPRTESGILKGKLRYLAPEQITDDGVDRRADVFTMGIVLWEILSGRRFFEGRRADYALLFELVSGTFPKVREVRADVPPALAALCDRAVSVDPDGRPPTALAFHRELEAALEALPAFRATHRQVGQFLRARYDAERRARAEAIARATAPRRDGTPPATTVDRPRAEDLDEAGDRGRRGLRLAIEIAVATIVVALLYAAASSRRGSEYLIGETIETNARVARDTR